MNVDGLPPIVGDGPTVLLLGNAPSVLSLAHQQYYGNPRNAFWTITGELYGFSASAPYPERAAALVSHGVAVWDVLKFCRRAGSLDSAVEPDSMVANDFAAFYREHPTITRVFFTGGAAETNYRRLVGVDDLRAFIRLPSTSPAHTMPVAQKLGAWREALAAPATGRRRGR
ncbi:DNA-deoxyinosine glycosylase [Mycobacterium sp. MS1601]|uniref:DNA-deoxyinosine glycosylase n=1 Tax=Mycobacterium sp. MS1601 TaxID=1936029 RepID=UPI00097955B6|nr:DNA-deoxyinosine glycosylase [Mycobacterium sp. MS1601]AQA04172.1 DNA-deoxyinosine glycosylase [Mycobacterium sp. MS1601]